MSSFKSPTSMSSRSSPFRRPQSPSSPSQYSAQPGSPSGGRNTASPISSPSKLKQSYTVSEEEEESCTITTPTKQSTTGRNADIQSGMAVSSTKRFPQSSPNSRPANLPISDSVLDPLSRLPPAMLQSLRESFSVLDPHSTGTITPASAHETLQNLGLDTSMMNQLFSPGGSQSVTLPQYLNQLATLLVRLSPPQELLNAFSAFDDDDSGQINVAELTQAVLATPPDAGEHGLNQQDVENCMEGYTGRRILGRGAIGIRGVKTINPVTSRMGGEIFRYQDFVGSITGNSLQGPGAVRA